MIKGSRTAVTADAAGQFAIHVHEKDMLIISYVGFQEKQVPVAGNNLVISLAKGDKSMEDVVVIGYGTQKRQNVTAAVATMDTKSIQEKPITRIDQAMIGQMPGVQVRQQTGMPGAGFTLLVRGTGSISAGTEPLYVIDGFPLDISNQNTAGGFSNGNPLNNLNPDDIESLQVLKDAAAGAIYGSRAANGVVLITTRRGQVGRTRLVVNANAGVSQAARKLDMLSAKEWIDMATELENTRWVASGTGRTADQTNAQRRAILGLAPAAYNTQYMPDDRWSMPGHPGLEYVNWQDSAFKTAPFQNYEVSASGGTDNVRYFVSGNYLNQAGILLNTGYTNYGARANVEVNAARRFKLGFNLAPTYSVIQAPSAEGKDNQLHHLYNMIPVVEDSAGMNSGAGKNSVYGWANSSISPIAYLNNSIGTVKTTRILFTTYGEFQILNGLTARSTFNFDQSNQTTKTYVSDFVAGNITDRLNSPGKNSSGSYAGFTKQNYVNENTLNFNRTFHEDHNLNIIAGVSYSYVHLENFNFKTAGGFANDLVNTLNNAIPNAASGVTITGTTGESNNTLFSYYSRAQYSYQGKYLLSASIRRDGSSRFGVKNQYGTFPSLSVGWRLSQERFMQPITFINDLKLRFSYGRSGNNNIGDYGAIPQVRNGNYNFGGSTPTAYTGQVPDGVPNPFLQWETSNTYDAGFDATVLSNRINIIFDAYQKKNTNLLLNVPVLAASGATTQTQNIGAVQNRGIELGIGATIVRIRNFSWTANGNIAFNQNKVLNLGPQQTVINISNAFGTGYPPFVMQVGKPMFSYFTIKNIGILTPQDTANPKVAKLTNQTVGDEKYLDANADGVIDASDRVISGKPTPTYTWGLTNNFRYKAFDLSVQMYGQHGGSIMSYLARAIDNPGNGTATTLGIWRDRWTAANQNWHAPRGRISQKAVPYTTSDWVYSTDFLRIQSITLGYNLKSVLKTSVFSSARVYVSLQNWFGWDKYKGGVNPEAQNTNLTTGSYPLPGDYGASPLNKSAVLGVNFGF